MSPRSRRQVLRGLGVVAAGTALTASVLASGSESPASGPADTDARAVQPDSDAVEWHTTYGDGDYQCKAVLDTQDGALLVGRTGGGRSDSAWLAAIGPDGEPRWTTTIETPGFTIAADAVGDEAGYTVLVTTDESPGLRLVSLDRDGQVTERHTLEAPEEMTGEAASVDFATNNVTNHARVVESVLEGYLIGGYLDPHAPGATDAEYEAWVRAVDPGGETRWSRRYDGATVTGIERLADGVLLAGSAGRDAWLQATDPDGTPRWQHTYGGVESEVATVAVPTDERILYGGRTGSAAGSHSKAVLVTTTADGEFVWRRTREPQQVADLLPLDGNFVMTGEPQARERTGRTPEKPVSLVDPWGRVRETATVSVDPGAPIGLATFDDGGVAVGGWDRRGGVWLAKVDFDAPAE
jgi:hypothetical protein